MGTGRWNMDLPWSMVIWGPDTCLKGTTATRPCYWVPGTNRPCVATVEIPGFPEKPDIQIFM